MIRNLSLPCSTYLEDQDVDEHTATSSGPFQQSRQCSVEKCELLLFTGLSEGVGGARHLWPCSHRSWQMSMRLLVTHGRAAEQTGCTR